MLKRFDELGRDSLESIDHRRAREAVLRCAACSEVISRRPRPIERRGAHRHHFVNPHGFSFHVGCFGRAERTTGSGRSTTEHTWFPGYAWSIVLCAGCGVHVGWRFDGPQDSFFALILSRVIETPGEDR